jgi:hypothetical protein
MATIITNGEPDKVSCDRCGTIATAKPWNHDTAMIPAGWAYAYTGRVRLMLCPACKGGKP